VYSARISRTLRPLLLYFAGVEVAGGALDEELAALLEEDESDDPVIGLADPPPSPEPLPDPPLSLELLAAAPPSDELLFALLLEPYPSANHPPPLN
jgi:hypothetical protein